MVLRLFAKTMERLRNRFDFNRFKKEEERTERATRTKRPPKRRRRR